MMMIEAPLVDNRLIGTYRSEPPTGKMLRDRLGDRGLFGDAKNPLAWHGCSCLIFSYWAS